MTLEEQCSGDPIIDVNLANDQSDNPFKHKYIIKYDSEIPPNCIMSIIFPLHPDKKKRILWTSGSLTALSGELNERLRECGGREVTVSSGNNFYRFRNITGTIYLVWAEDINEQNINKLEGELRKGVPLLIEMDRHWGYKHIFIFGNNSTNVTNLCDIQLFDPFFESIFCCETDPREEIVQRVQTVTSLEADQVTRNLVDRSIVALDQVAPPFE